MRKERKKVAIISRESNNKTPDIAMLEAELLDRGVDVTVLSRLLTKEKSLKALGYIGHVLRQEAAILAADVVVLDTYCIPASMLPHLKDTKIVQMWHALGAVKKFGWQTVGKEGGSSERTAKLMKMHHGYDHVVCCSDVTAGFFSEAFRTDREKIVKYGLPRIDLIKSIASGSRHEDTAKRIYTRYPQLRPGKETAAGGRGDRSHGQKRTILYAPTFRRGKAVDVQSLIDALDPEKYDLVVKLHPLYRGSTAPQQEADETGVGSPSPRAGQPGGQGVCPHGRINVIYDEDFSSNDWLAVADIIISDYSSFVIESTLADKPLYIYAYDLDEYAENTGLNIDFEAEPIAPYVFEDAVSLAKALDEEYDYEAMRAFRRRYIDIATEPAGDADPQGSDGVSAVRNEENYCTARLADFIESL